MVLSDYVYVIDYTHLNIDQRVLVESETDGYTCGLDLLNVKATGEGTNWWAQSVKKRVYSDYVHIDRLDCVIKPGGRWGRLAAMNPVQEYPWRHILYKKRKKDLIMSLPIDGWKNKRGTSGRSCKCGSWKQHWINGSRKAWPASCCVAGCTGTAEVGAHVYNTSSTVHGEYIVPACKGCNARMDEFSLKGIVTLVPANKQETCEQ